MSKIETVTIYDRALNCDEIHDLLESDKIIVFDSCILLIEDKLEINKNIDSLIFFNCSFEYDTIIDVKSELKTLILEDCRFGYTTILHLGNYKDVATSKKLEINIYEDCDIVRISKIFHDNDIEICVYNNNKINELISSDCFVQKLYISGTIKEITIEGLEHPAFDMDELDDNYFNQIIKLETTLDCAFGSLELDCTSDYVTINSDLVSTLSLDECNIKNFYFHCKKTNILKVYESKLETAWFFCLFQIDKLAISGNIHKDSYISFKNIKVNKIELFNLINSGSIHLYNAISQGPNSIIGIVDSDLGKWHYINCDFRKSTIKYFNSILDNGVYTGTKWPNRENFTSTDKSGFEHSLRHIFTQIKNSYAKKNDRYNENLFYQYEMRTLKNELKKDKNKYSLIDSILINFNWITSDFGTNPIRSIMSLIFCHFMFVTYLFINSNCDDISSYLNFFSYSINPVHRLQDNPVETVTYTHTQSLIVKIYLSILLYQIVISLRKVSRLR